MQLVMRIVVGVAFVAGLALAGAAAQEKEVKGLKYEVYQDAKKDFRWRLKSANGNVIANGGQGFATKDNCVGSIKLIQAEAGKKKSSLTFELYQDAKEEHRWRCKSANGQTVAQSSQGYARKADAERGVEILKGSGGAQVVEAETK